jgi:hypothetical protein
MYTLTPAPIRMSTAASTPRPADTSTAPGTPTLTYTDTTTPTATQMPTHGTTPAATSTFAPAAIPTRPPTSLPAGPFDGTPAGSIALGPQKQATPAAWPAWFASTPMPPDAMSSGALMSTAGPTGTPSPLGAQRWIPGLTYKGLVAYWHEAYPIDCAGPREMGA